MKLTNLRRMLIGNPFPTSMDVHERVDKFRGLAIFASDPISSNAYATEAIMAVLVVLGSQSLSLTLPLAGAVAALIFLVIFSYIQTILHYPEGGGAYRVSKDNLGTFPALFAGGALLIDYVLTVAVSVSAGVRAITSAFPATIEHRVFLALLAIALITWINLRGVRESGTIFALPTYAFVGGVGVMILIGLARTLGWFGLPPLEPVTRIVQPQITLEGFAFTWLLLRAFAGGCTALTGIEAISDGVKAFQPPESKNAAKTMLVMGIMAMSLFLGISFLATHLHLVPSEGESILSQLARQVSGRGLMYYWVQFSTMLILILAANTGYQDFPRLSSFLAQDGFLPRWMKNRGDRLVFSSGIMVLTVLSALMVILFQADEIAMLPLYALGVMLGFTLSQSGMFRLMGRVRKLKPGETLKTDYTTLHPERWTLPKRAVNLVGALTTFVVLLILVATKFMEGAWVVVLAIPLLVWLFSSIHHHYQRVAKALRTRDLTMEDLSMVADVVVVPIGDVHRGTLRALRYARRLSKNVRAVCIVTSEPMEERLIRRWNRFPEITGDIPLICLHYDYRDILTPLVEYIKKVNQEEFPDHLTTVVIPDFIPESAWVDLLHNRTADSLRRELRQYQDIVIIEVPFHVLSVKAWRALRQSGPERPASSEYGEKGEGEESQITSEEAEPLAEEDQ